mmetsp:Transcript_149924/g.481726  ORF Transcript_149924/g.481726 Transcript_149924/m.481726 type:complete len:83 (-) Transcript_149924:81-329(-)
MLRKPGRRPGFGPVTRGGRAWDELVEDDAWLEGLLESVEHEHCPKREHEALEQEGEHVRAMERQMVNPEKLWELSPMPRPQT